eukprot:gene2683-2722_t
MRAIMDPIVRRFVAIGTFRVRWPDGKISIYQGDPGPDITLSVRDWATVRRVITNPVMAIGEAYMDGGLQPVGCTIYDVLDLFLSNIASEASSQPIIDLQLWLGRALRPDWAGRDHGGGQAGGVADNARIDPMQLRCARIKASYGPGEKLLANLTFRKGGAREDGSYVVFVDYDLISTVPEIGLFNAATRAGERTPVLAERYIFVRSGGEWILQ